MKITLQEKGRIHYKSLQSGAQIYSVASSNENTRCKDSSEQGMGKIGENFGVEPDKSQKQIRGDR